MRGNHRIWFRQDYTEPAPMTISQRNAVESVVVEPKSGTKTWNSVFMNGAIIGYVKTCTGIQSFRDVDMDWWCPSKWDWNRSDPPHGWAVLSLLEHVKNKARKEE